MIIDQTFMWLYAIHKLGLFLTPFAILSGFGFIVSLCSLIGCYDSDEERLKLLIPMFGKLSFWSALVCFFSSLVAIVSPSKDEVKAYAIYAISKQVSNSPQAKELFDAGIKYLENKTK